ncbi:MAG: type II toxin-antitoxin system RelB/DinJ family antitoxin [Sulfurovum sp.]
MYVKPIKIQTSLRIEQNSLQDAKKILDELGMNFSEAVNIFTKMIVAHRGLPFEVRLLNNTDELTKKLQLALDEVAKVEQGTIKSSHARDLLDEL